MIELDRKKRPREADEILRPIRNIIAQAYLESSAPRRPTTSSNRVVSKKRGPTSGHRSTRESERVPRRQASARRPTSGLRPGDIIERSAPRCTSGVDARREPDPLDVAGTRTGRDSPL
jgi:hypothetical protein